MANINPVQNDISGGIKAWLIVLIIIIVFGLGGVVWFFFFRPIPEAKNNQASEAKIECHSNDKILCNYITSWEAPKEYRFTNRETVNGVTKISVYEYDLNDPPKIHARIEGGDETITIGDTLYTKWDGFWSKKTIGNSNGNNPKQPISKPSPEDAAPIEPHNYQKIGKEQCGTLTCYKYKITDPQNPGLEQFIWFDTGEYKLRQLRFESEGSISDQVFEYIPVDISEPSPVREQ